MSDGEIEGPGESLAPVLPWAEVRGAARVLFHTWVEHHDLKWVKAAWAHLPQIGDSSDDGGARRAHSLIVLMALALLSSQFALYAFDEVGYEPQYDALDAMKALDVEPFYLGQVYKWEPPVNSDGTVSLGKVLRILAEDVVPLVVAIFRARYRTDYALMVFFATVPATKKHGRPVSELRVLREFSALDWCNRNCPVPPNQLEQIWRVFGDD